MLDMNTEKGEEVETAAPVEEAVTVNVLAR